MNSEVKKENTLNLPKGYKQTEVGIIPEDWEVTELSKIGESIIGLTYSPTNISPFGKLVLRSSNVQNGRLSFEDNVFVEMDFPDRVIVKEGDILICVRNGSKRLIGKCALIDKKTEGSAFGAFMSVFRTENSKFVFFQFQSNVIQRQINESLGATINQITNKDLASFKIPIPPTKAEQTAIATALSDMDALIENLEKLIAKKQLIKQGAMQKLLKPKEGWEVKTLGEIFNFKQGVQCGIEKQNTELKKGLIRFIRIIDLSQEGEPPRYIKDPGSSYHINENDLFMVRYGTPGLLGFGYKGVIANNLFSLRPKININRLFFYYILSFMKEEILELSSSTTMAAINFTSLKTLVINFPKSIEEQNRIAQILSDMDAEIEKLENQLAKYKMIKTGMMQELLTGKKRLI